MASFEKLLDGIYRLKVPFESLYTSVFLIETKEEAILFDFATTVFDAENIIIPALRELGKSPNFLVASHTHGDHIGGLERLHKEFPKASVLMYDEAYAKEHKEIEILTLQNGQYIIPGIKAINIPGHSNSCCVLLDERTNTLLTGDAVQLFGIDRFGLGISDINKYISSIDILRKLGAENLVASHEFAPLGALSYGKKATEDYLDCALDCLKKAQVFVLDRIKKGYNKEEILREYNNQGLPTISLRHINMLSLSEN